MDLDPTTIGAVITGAVTAGGALAGGAAYALRKRSDAAAEQARAQRVEAEGEGVEAAARFRDSETTAAALHASLRMAEWAREDLRQARADYASVSVRLDECMQRHEADRAARLREREEDDRRCEERIARALSQVREEMPRVVRGEVRRTLSPSGTQATPGKSESR